MSQHVRHQRVMVRDDADVKLLAHCLKTNQHVCEKASWTSPDFEKERAGVFSK